MSLGAATFKATWQRLLKWTVHSALGRAALLLGVHPVGVKAEYAQGRVRIPHRGNVSKRRQSRTVENNTAIRSKSVNHPGIDCHTYPFFVLKKRLEILGQ